MGASRTVARPGRIPWETVQRWMDRAEIDPEERLFVQYMVEVLDSYYLVNQHEKINAGLQKVLKQKGGR